MVFMLKTPTARQTELEMVTLESLVPADHLLRKIDAVIDFTFIRRRRHPAECHAPGHRPHNGSQLAAALAREHRQPCRRTLG